MDMTVNPSAEVSPEHTPTDPAVWLYQYADVVWGMPCCLMLQGRARVHLQVR
jgi:hypothetical protein